MFYRTVIFLLRCVHDFFYIFLFSICYNFHSVIMFSKPLISFSNITKLESRISQRYFRKRYSKPMGGKKIVFRRCNHAFFIRFFKHFCWNITKSEQTRNGIKWKSLRSLMCFLKFSWYPRIHRNYGTRFLSLNRTRQGCSRG